MGLFSTSEMKIGFNRSIGEAALGVGLGVLVGGATWLATREPKKDRKRDKKDRGKKHRRR